MSLSYFIGASRVGGWPWTAALPDIRSALSRHIRKTLDRCADVNQAAGRPDGHPLTPYGDCKAIACRQVSLQANSPRGGLKPLFRAKATYSGQQPDTFDRSCKITRKTLAKFRQRNPVWPEVGDLGDDTARRHR